MKGHPVAKVNQFPLAHLVQVPKTAYVPSWATDCDTLKETFKRARRSVGKQTRIRVKTLHVAKDANGVYHAVGPQL